MDSDDIENVDIDIDVGEYQARAECAFILDEIISRMKEQFRNDKEVIDLLQELHPDPDNKDRPRQRRDSSIFKITTTLDSISEYQSSLKCRFLKSLLSDLSMYVTCFGFCGVLVLCYAAFLGPQEHKIAGGTIAVVLELVAAILSVFKEFEPWRQKIKELQRFGIELKSLERKAGEDIEGMLRRSNVPSVEIVS